MPTRIQGSSSRTSTQIHLTGRDLLEMQRRHDETAARLRTEHEQAKAEHLAQLSGAATWLHQRVVAIVGLLVYCVVLLTTLATSGSNSAGSSVFGFLVIGLAVGPAVVDWWNFRTLHGRINWLLLKLDHPGGYWWAIVGMVLFFPVPGIAYFVDCIRTAPAVAQSRRARVQQEIARLEQDLHPELTPEEKQPVH